MSNRDFTSLKAGNCETTRLPLGLCRRAELKTDDSAEQRNRDSIIGGQEFDDAEPVLLILPVGREIVFALRSRHRQITFFPEFWIKTRDTQTIHRAPVPLYSLRLFTGHYGATGAL
jgi:hypothetical protein